MTKDDTVKLSCAKLFAIISVFVALVYGIARYEATFMDDILKECPSGTAIRVCDETEAKLEQECIGSVCVRVVKILRVIGGAK